MTKYIVASAVVLILIVFPGLSWYYLDKGRDLRRDLLTELESDTKLNDVVIVAEGDTVQLSELVKGKTTVLLREAQQNTLKVKQLQEQFEKAYTFQVLRLRQIGQALKSDELLSLNDLGIIFPEGDNMALIDTALTVRRTYNLEDTSFNQLVEHVSIVLPRKPEKDIIMK